MSANAASAIESRAVAAQILAPQEAPKRASDQAHAPRTRLRWRCPSIARFLGKGFLGLPMSTWLVWDLLIVIVAVCNGYRVFPPFELELTPHIVLWKACAVFAFSITVASLVLGLYERETLKSRTRILTRMTLTVVAAGIIAYAIIYVIMYATVSRRVAAFAMGISWVVGTGVRLTACWAMQKVPQGLLVVGTRKLFDSFRKAQHSGLLSEYQLIGHATVKPEPGSPPPPTDEFGLGPIEDQIEQLGGQRVTDIVVSAEAAKDPHVMKWVVPALQRGCRVTNEAIFYEKATGQILVDEITPAWFLFADLKVHCDRHAMIKRLADLFLAIVGLLVSAPLWPLIALAVKLCDGGPVFHSQDRVGQNGAVFRLHKFRTMKPNAENGRSVWASPNDPRVTRVGRFLRRARLDELPQLYDVLVGHMSVVGPRPERPDIVEDLCPVIPYYAERHLVKPGITGWAQISYHYGASIEDAKRKLQFDLYYLKHMSLELDLTIMLRTAGTFLRGAC